MLITYILKCDVKGFGIFQYQEKLIEHNFLVCLGVR